MVGPEKLPISKVVLFALGQLGWSLCSFGVGNLMNYFYMPPEAGKAPLFPTFFYQGSVLGIFTVLGLITFVARFFDAVTNPLIANWSDRSTSRLGRRTFFMAFSAAPFALFSFLIFFPISPGASMANAVWLAVTLLLLYFFFVCYTTPYTALISEYGHTPEERLTLSTAISITWALGFAAGQGVFALQPIVERSFALTPTRAFQGVMLAFAAVSLVCMLLPVLFVDERRHAAPRVSKENVREALTAAFKDRNFRTFCLSDLTYWMALTFVQSGMVYYMTTLLHPKNDIREDTALVTPLMSAMFVLSFLCYVPVNFVARKVGKKRLVQAGFLLLIVTFAMVTGMGLLPAPPMAYAFTLAAIAAIPMAIFGILPNVIVSDIAEADGKRTGTHKAGIFFGTRTFMMNLGISLANLLFPRFLLLGKDVDNPLGVRLSGVAALFFCVTGLFVFSLYDERSVLRDIGEKDEGAPKLTGG